MKRTPLLVISSLFCLAPLTVISTICSKNNIDLFLVVDSNNAKLIRGITTFQMLAAQRIINIALDVGDSSGAIRLAFFAGFQDNRNENLLRFTSFEWSPVVLKRVESICNDIEKNRTSYQMLSAADAVNWYEKTFRATGNKFLSRNAEQVLLILYSTSVLKNLKAEKNFYRQALSWGLTVHAIRFLSKADKLGYKYGTDLVIRESEIPQFFFKGGLENYVQEKICGKCSYNKPNDIAKCRYSFEAKKCQAEINFEPNTESKKRSECKPYTEAFPCELEQCCPTMHTDWSDWECVVEPCGTERSTRTRYLSNTTIISFIQRLYQYNRTEHRYILDCPLEEYKDDPQCLKVSYCSIDDYCSKNDPVHNANLIGFIIIGVSVLIGLIFISLAIKRHKDEQSSDRSVHGSARRKKVEAPCHADAKQHQKSLFKQNVTLT